jgi:hypothetical protein
MGKTQLQSQGRKIPDEAARMRRAMLDACGRSLRHRLGQELEGPVPPSLSRLIAELRKADTCRRDAST